MKAADLRKAILQYAVEGKLVPQDIHDEPASILYEKIIAEKENLIKQGKIKKEKPLPPITDNEIPYDIPENWKWVRLGEVCEINPRNKLENNIEVSFIPMRLISDGYQNKHTYEIKIWKEIKNGFTHFRENDILMSKITPCFQNLKSCIATNLVSGYGAGTTELHVLRPIKIHNLYILYFLKTPNFIKNGVINMTGTAGQQRIPVSYISTYLFPLPPLKEQERIVKKVDELMALCDKLEQEEEKLLALDKNFMENLPKSILQYAVEGKLVNQDIHDEPASILYEKIKVEKENLIKQGKIKKEKPLPPITDGEIPYDIPENWKWVRLGEVCDLYTGNSINAETKNKKYANLSQGYDYIATKDVNFNTTIDYNNGIKIPFNEINFKIAKKNTILLCIEGGSAGRKIGFLNQDVCFGNKLCNINGLLLHNQYLFYLAQSPIFLSIFNANKAGIIGGVSVNLIKNIIFPLPPLKEQERIVKKVDKLLTYCNKLKDIV